MGSSGHQASDNRMVTPPSQQRQDFLDSIFEPLFNMCRTAPKEKQPSPDPDVLDYVFEHVESFATCEGQERLALEGCQPPNVLGEHRTSSNNCGNLLLSNTGTIERDNSLLEENPIHPLNGVLSRKFHKNDNVNNRHETAQRNQRSNNNNKNGGGDPDMLDYVFEHVESYTCAENAPSNALEDMSKQHSQMLQSHFLTQKGMGNDMNYQAAKQRVDNYNENAELREDHIQLYFKPQKNNKEKMVYQG